MIDVVAAVIVRNGRLLLTQRAPEQDHPWLWHCPGGKCEGPNFGDRGRRLDRTLPGYVGETWEDAAIRETREELGLDGPVTVPRKRGEVQPIAEYVSGHYSGPARNIAWYAVDIGDQKPLPIEGIGIGWFAVDRLRAVAATGLLTIPTRAVIEALIAYASRA